MRLIDAMRLRRNGSGPSGCETGGPEPQRRAFVENGTVTAEFAVILPAVMVVALLLFSSARAVTVGMECQEAARAAAREIVVAADSGAANPSGVAARIAGTGVSVAVAKGGREVAVTTRCPVLPGPLGIVPASMTGKAVAILHE
ncbi:pilus assembly protein TadE [Bifidobacterium margollesii]|uniref:Pilus assembly protein TadE n=1 Tax=Bifidobacterium margollesii TaxID=2020964 RepID=A0A2N5JC44_9BIFI|nr:pilus assembly protein TadE [Bifidobacterium margollesii]